MGYGSDDSALDETAWKLAKDPRWLPAGIIMTVGGQGSDQVGPTDSPHPVIMHRTWVSPITP